MKLKLRKHKGQGQRCVTKLTRVGYFLRLAFWLNNGSEAGSSFVIKYNHETCSSCSFIHFFSFIKGSAALCWAVASSSLS
jgi:hypothetical protein